MHTRKTLTEAELIAEIQAIQGGAVSSFEASSPTIIGNDMIQAGIEAMIPIKKSRGRPKGSKNRPKVK